MHRLRRLGDSAGTVVYRGHDVQVITLLDRLARRSYCRVRMGAVIEVGGRIVATGWNHPGNGYGECAERHALRRAPADVEGATVYVAGWYSRNWHPVTARPCEKCLIALKNRGISRIVWLDKNVWIMEEI